MIRRLSLVGVATLLAAVVAAASAYAAVLCSNPSGSVFVRTACKAHETQLDPAALGLVGPQGPSGPPGPAGPTGPTGPANVVVRFVDTDTPSGSNDSATASCNPGERATGGGRVAALGRLRSDVLLRARWGSGREQWHSHRLALLVVPEQRHYRDDQGVRRLRELIGAGRGARGQGARGERR
jgi:hypothetical protein